MFTSAIISIVWFAADVLPTFSHLMDMPMVRAANTHDAAMRLNC